MRLQIPLLACFILLAACNSGPGPFPISEVCSPECEVGARRCTAEGFELCLESAPGCGRFRLAGTCASGEICEEGVCLSPDAGDEPEPDAGTALVLDLYTTKVSGQVRVGGQTPQLFAELCPVGSNALHVGFRSVLGESTSTFSIPCDTENFRFEAYLPRGRYEVQVVDALALASPPQPLATNLPRTSFVTEVDLDEASETLLLDVRTAHLDGTIHRNGLPAQVDAVACATEGAAAIVRFSQVPHVHEDPIELRIPCDAGSLDFQVHLTHGRWKAEVALADGPRTAVVRNRSEEPLFRGIEILVDESQGPLLLDVPDVELTGSVKVNGAPLVIYEYCGRGYSPSSAVVELFETNQGLHQIFRVPCDRPEVDFAEKVYPGTYRVTVAGEWSGNFGGLKHSTSDLPLTPYLVAEARSFVAASNTLDIDVPLVTVEVEPLVDGAAPQVLDLEDCTEGGPWAAALSLKSESGSDFALLYMCYAGFDVQALKVYPGSYLATLIGWGEKDSTIGDSILHRPSVTVGPGTKRVVIDFSSSTHPIGSRLLWNGTPLASSEECKAWESAASVEVADSKTPFKWRKLFDLTCHNPSETFAVQLAPGTYRSRVMLHPEYLATLGYPPNTVIDLDPFEVSGTGNHDFNIQTREVEGILRVDGEAPGIRRTCLGAGAAVRFVREGNQEPHSLRVDLPCDEDEMGFRALLAPGIYRVEVLGLPEISEAAPVPPYTNTPQAWGVALPRLEVR